MATDATTSQLLREIRPFVSSNSEAEADAIAAANAAGVGLDGRYYEHESNVAGLIIG